MVNITEDPQSTGPLLVGETAMFTCQARSIPSSTVTWFRFQHGIAGLVDNGDDIIISSQSQPEDNFTTRSVLSVRVTGDEDFTRYFCVGDNGFDNSTSDVATLVRVQAGMFPGPTQLCYARRKAGQSLGMKLVCQCLVMLSSRYTPSSFPTHTDPHPCTPPLPSRALNSHALCMTHTHFT